MRVPQIRSKSPVSILKITNPLHKKRLRSQLLTVTKNSHCVAEISCHCPAMGLRPRCPLIKQRDMPFENTPMLSRGREWSLIIGRGRQGLHNEGAGASEVLPLQKGGWGGRKILAILKTGHKTFWGSLNTGA